MTVYWAEHAVLPTGLAHGVLITAAKGVITGIQVDAAPSGTRLAGLTLPGFANAHSHAFHRALRGTTHSDGGTFWSWRERMYAIAATLTPSSYLELATAVFAEMVLSGYTVVGEFHYVHGEPDGTPYVDTGAMELAILEAAAAAGIRITLLDALYLAGGVHKPLTAQQLRFSDGSVGAWHARRSSLPETPTSRVGAAVHSLRAVSPAQLGQVAALGLGTVHAHVSEQPAENDSVRAAYDATPVGLLGEFLGAGFTAVHATHLTNDDVGDLGGSFVCFCPTTERDLADGIGPARALADAGARLALGSDQNAVVDPFEEVRGLEMNERLASGQRGRFTPSELLTAATANGYASLGWNGGTLAVGQLADFVTIDTSSVRTVGSDLDQVWLSATSADVRNVVVHGELVVTDGVHRLGDVAALLAASIERTRP